MSDLTMRTSFALVAAMIAAISLMWATATVLVGNVRSETEPPYAVTGQDPVSSFPLVRVVDPLSWGQATGEGANLL